MDNDNALLAYRARQQMQRRALSGRDPVTNEPVHVQHSYSPIDGFVPVPIEPDPRVYASVSAPSRNDEMTPSQYVLHGMMPKDGTTTSADMRLAQLASNAFRFAPITGQIEAGASARMALDRGNHGEAAFHAGLGALPGIGGASRVIANNISPGALGIAAGMTALMPNESAASNGDATAGGLSAAETAGLGALGVFGLYKAGQYGANAVRARRAASEAAEQQAARQKQHEELQQKANELRKTYAEIPGARPSPPRPMAVNKPGVTPDELTDDDVDHVLNQITSLQSSIQRANADGKERLRSSLQPFTQPRIPYRGNAFLDDLAEQPGYRNAHPTDVVGPGRAVVATDASVFDAREAAASVKSQLAAQAGREKAGFRAELRRRDESPADGRILSPRDQREQDALDRELDAAIKRIVPNFRLSTIRTGNAGGSGHAAGVAQIDVLTRRLHEMASKRAKERGADGDLKAEARALANSLRRLDYNFQPFRPLALQQRADSGQFGPISKEGRVIWDAIKETAPNQRRRGPNRGDDPPTYDDY
jgi:hypothetical protein